MCLRHSQQRDLLDRPERIVGRRERRQVLHEWVIEGQLAGIAQLEDRGRRERLRDGRDPVQGCVVRTPTACQVGGPDMHGSDHTSVDDESDGDSRDPVLVRERDDLGLHVQEGLRRPRSLRPRPRGHPVTGAYHVADGDPLRRRDGPTSRMQR